MTRQTLLFSLVAVCGLLGPLGCSTANTPPPGKTGVLLPGGGTISSEGFHAGETKAEIAGDSVTIPLPAKSVVTIARPDPVLPPKISIEIPSETELVMHSTSAKVEIPRSFAPPAPPSPHALARAASLKWFYFAGIALAVGALFLAWRGHMKAAGIAGLGAVGVPLLGNFVSSDAALWLSIAAGVGCVTLFAAWHLIQNNPELEEKIKARLRGSRR